MVDTDYGYPFYVSSSEGVFGSGWCISVSTTVWVVARCSDNCFRGARFVRCKVAYFDTIHRGGEDGASSADVTC